MLEKEPNGLSEFTDLSLFLTALPHPQLVFKRPSNYQLRTNIMLCTEFLFPSNSGQLSFHVVQGFDSLV